MAYFPLFVDLKDRKIVIIGGGNVAYRKVVKLLEFEPQLTLIAPEICSEIKDLANIYSNLILEYKKYEINDIKNSFFVISATNDNFVNKQIAQDCKNLNIPINSVDDMENCSFLFPAIIKQDSLVIGLSTSGKAPNLSAHIRKRIEENLPQNLGEIADILGVLRKKLKNKISRQKDRAKIIHNLIEYSQTKDFKISSYELEEKMLSLIKEIDK